jgi:two-component system chemotaxis response regulator CheY
MARILLVDDDHDFLNVASRLLQHADIDVVTCMGAQEALDQAKRREFDVIITDANMKPHSGYELIRSIKSIPSYQLIPIAMITGRREKRDVERAVAVGAQDYIVKPIDPERFIKKIQELVSRSEDAHRSARFGEIHLEEIGKITTSVMIVGLSETGVLLDSDHKLLEGSIVTLSSEIFEKIGCASPQAKVKSCVPGATQGSYEARATFQNLEERTLLKIRQFVQLRLANHKKNARPA